MPKPSTLDCLERLIGFDTTSCNSNLKLVAWAEDYLRGHGAETRRVYNAEGDKANLWVTFGLSSAPGLILSGHTDVVPVDGQTWREDPFKLKERNGCYFGRGACDMKGFLAACLAAAPQIAKTKLTRPVHFAFSYDEEIGCVGVRTLLQDLKDRGLHFEACFVGEPTGMKVAIGHKGKRSLRATITGISGHSSLAPQLVNAVEYGARIVAKVSDIGLELAREGKRDALYNIAHSTAHVGTFHGGSTVNIVPDKAFIDFEFRVLPEDDAEALDNRVRDYVRNVIEPAMHAIHPETGVSFDLGPEYPGLVTEQDANVTTLAQKFAATNDAIKVAYGAEAGLFVRYLDVPTIICGPGSIDQAHKPDEYVESAQIELCERFIDRLLGYAGGHAS